MNLARIFAVALLAGTCALMVWAGAGEPAAGENPLRFADVSAETGLKPTAFHALGVADLDGDGLPDLICGGWPIRADLYQARLYKNDGKFRFSDRTPAAWKDNRAPMSGCAVGDVDNDGKIDFFLCAVGGNMNPGGPERRGSLFLNEGNFQFKDVTEQALPGAGPMLDGRWRSAAFFDYDNDGWLDLLVTGMTIPVGAKDAKKTVGTSALYRNRGKGPDGKWLGFEDVTAATGLKALLVDAGANALGVACADFNNDGYQDLCITCFMTPCKLLLNNRQGGFSDVSDMFSFGRAGQRVPAVGACWGDFDNDGWLDLFVTTDCWVSGGGASTLEYHLDRFKLHAEPDTLFRNVRGRSFMVWRDLPEFFSEGHDCQFEDVDNNGTLDLYATCHGWNNTNIGTPGGNPLYLNAGKGRFRRAAAEVGCAPVENYVSGAVVDLDGDGALDIVTTHFNSGVFKVYRNELNKKGVKNHLQVIAEGTRSNRSGIGARVYLHPEGTLTETAKGKTPSRPQALAWREIQSSRGYCTATPPSAHFGVNPAKTYDVEVVFPASGQRIQAVGVTPGRRLVMREPMP